MIVIRLCTDHEQGEADGDDVEILLLFAQAHETLVKHSGNALGYFKTGAEHTRGNTLSLYVCMCMCVCQAWRGWLTGGSVIRAPGIVQTFTISNFDYCLLCLLRTHSLSMCVCVWGTTFALSQKV